jgi:hypothetical protein
VEGVDDWVWGVEGHAMTPLVFRLSGLVVGNGHHLRVDSKGASLVWGVVVG